MKRFWDKVAKAGEDECWIWLGKLGRNGRGTFCYQGRTWNAPRFAYHLANGGIPEGSRIRSICKNPACVNPHHLRSNDMMEKFLSTIDKDESSGCWHWTGKSFSGLLSRSPQRASYLLFKGPIEDDGLYVKVTCGNKSCVNPDHIVVETREVRFWKYVDKIDGQCWEWLGARMTERSPGVGNYGILWDKTVESSFQNISAHRLSYQLHHGAISDNMHVCHTCDNPPCVNPDHLFLARAADNMRDKFAKMRHPMGSKHYAAKLTEGIVRDIRQRVADGEKQNAVAKALGLSKQAVNDIVLGKAWKHVQPLKQAA
jgi:hypothetical protein